MFRFNIRVYGVLINDQKQVLVSDEPYYDIPGKSILIFEVNLDIVY